MIQIPKKGMTKACQRHPIHLWVFPCSDSPIFVDHTSSSPRSFRCRLQLIKGQVGTIFALYPHLQALILRKTYFRQPNFRPKFPDSLPDLFPQELRQDRQVELQAVAGDFDRRLEELRGSLRREAEHARCWEAGRRG